MTEAEARRIARAWADRRLAPLWRLKRELATGRIGMTPVLLLGRPLGDYLDMDDVAELLNRLGSEEEP